MVLVVSPSRDNLSDIIQISEPVLIDTDISKEGIEALHKGVLSGLAGADASLPLC